MVTLTNADSALKSVYLDVVSNLLNTKVNPFMGMIEKKESDVYGKEIIKIAPFGLNGGVGAGDESGALPRSGNNGYMKFVSTLKNLYGNIEISDKALRASANNAGAFVNLLNAEMEGLMESSVFNFGRMLFGDGTGKLATVTEKKTFSFVVDSVKNLVEGQVLDFYKSDKTIIPELKGSRIVKINRATKEVSLDNIMSISLLAAGAFMTIQNSYEKEITGLEAIFAETGSLYGLDKATSEFLNPTKVTTDTISEDIIQEVIDDLEENTGSEIDYIVCSHKMRREYQKSLAANYRNVNTIELDGGFKAVSFNGIPVVADRFVADDTMYLLNSKDFELHQLCDWQWLEGDDGRVIKQKAGYPAYEATLVKYADLMCAKPSGQAKIILN